MIRAWASSPSAAIFRRRITSASRSCSMNRASAAPRDNAARPSAPVPAKASSTTASANGTPSAANRPCERMLNSASRARSLVGLTVSPGGANSRRPRCLPPTIRMGRRASGPKLLAEHLPRHLVDRAARQIAELERPEREADQPSHLKPEMFEHATHLSVFPLAQSHRDPGIAALLALKLGGDRAIGDAIDRKPFIECSEPLGMDLAVNTYLVTAQPAGRRQFEAPRQCAVVGQQQQTFGIEIEPPHRNHPRQLVWQHIEDRRAAFLVG